MTILEILAKLIEGDEVEHGWEKEYTHSKTFDEVDGNVVTWIKISTIEHEWYSVENSWEPSVRRVLKKPLIELDGDVIKYNPTIIKDYIENHRT